MKIKHIQLRFFRNYESVDFVVNARQSFLMGDNAQGKTNFLEAIYYLSTIRSFRTNDDNELIQFNRDFAKLHILYERNQKENELEIVISKQGKYVTYNNQSILRMSDVMGQLNAVIFSPLDLKFLFGSPKDRRKFMDMELGKISPSYLNDLLLAQKLLKERNAHLKSYVIDEVYLDVVTAQLVDVEGRLIQARSTFLRLLEESSCVTYKQMTNEPDHLSIRYQSCIPVDELDKMRKELLLLHQNNKERDKEQRMTGIGTHREDFTLYLGDYEVQSFGSQGQKRSAVLSLKIGLLSVVKRRIKEYPILLLDDVLSELDENHRIKLFQVIPEEVQVFITATDINQNEKNKLEGDCFYQVTQETITKEE